MPKKLMKPLLNQVAIKVDLYSLYKAVQVLKSLALLYIPFIPEYTNTLMCFN